MWAHLPFIHRIMITDSFGKDRLREGLYRAILAWRSLAHDYIHDLLGLFEERSQLFLVSPLTASGTLTQWRKNLQASDSTTEIHKLVRFQCLSEQLSDIDNIRQMRQVAEAIHFIHTQGVVHGDLCGVRISTSHCQQFHMFAT